MDNDIVDQMRTEAAVKDRVYQLKNTVGKLYRDFKSPLHENDYDIVDQFVHDPRFFLDKDLELAMNMKQLYDKRKLQLKERAEMGIYHLNNVTV